MGVQQPNRLANAGVKLTRLGLGCAQLGGLYLPMSDSEAHELVDQAWQLGVRHFDTAPYYGFGLSERRLGNALRSRPREEYVLSSKVGRLLRPDAGVRRGECGWCEPLPFRPHYDYSFDGILRSYEDSLQRMGLSRIDILYVHDIGNATHASRHAFHWEQLTRGGGFRALERLREGGEIRAFGIGVNEWQVVDDALDVCPLDCVLLAGRYTLLEQVASRPLMERCLRAGTAVVIGGPFNSGILAGNNMFNYEEAPPDVLRRVQAISAICQDHNVPLAAAALQFPMAHPAVVSCIPGAQNSVQLSQNARWFAQALPSAFWQALQAAGLVGAEACPKGGHGVD